MIRLALCITELDWGGAERAISEIAVRLDRARFDVTIYSLREKPIDDARSCVPFLEEHGIPIHFLNISGIFSLPKAMKKLRRLLREQKPDIFLSFMFHANFLGRLAARSAGVPHIISGLRVAEKRQKFHNWLDYATSRFVEKYVCVSQSVADFAAEEIKLPREKLCVIPNGIDLKNQNAGVFEKSHKKRILFVGRLDYQKGLDWFFPTIPDWLDELTSWEVWFVGDGPLRNELMKHLASHSFDAVRSRIKMMGWRDDVPQLISESAIIILPSRWEGMPNVILEAMAAKKPVVASDVEGIEELLGSHCDIQTFPFGDEVLFSAKLLTFTENPDTAESVGLENFERVGRHFSLESVIARYSNFFEEICKKP
ncbi:MAG: glycosyltransferase [Thermoguttaceae bacterium]